MIDLDHVMLKTILDPCFFFGRREHGIVIFFVWDPVNVNQDFDEKKLMDLVKRIDEQMVLEYNRHSSRFRAVQMMFFITTTLILLALSLWLGERTLWLFVVSCLFISLIVWMVIFAYSIWWSEDRLNPKHREEDPNDRNMIPMILLTEHTSDETTSGSDV